jgi:hypothetical protein
VDWRPHLELGRVEEVRRANGGAADIPLRTAADHSHLLLLHDVEQLCADLSRLAQAFHLQEVVIAPVATVPIGLPLLIHVQQCQVVALWDEELLACRVALLRSIRRPARQPTPHPHVSARETQCKRLLQRRTERKQPAQPMQEMSSASQLQNSSTN